MSTDDKDDVSFDYASVKRRIQVAKIKREHAEKARFAHEYTERCARRFKLEKDGAPKTVLAKISGFVDVFVRGDDTRLVLAGLALLGFSGWIGVSLYAQHAEQTKRAFTQRCSDNNLNYASNGVCYDNNHKVQTIDRDGAVKKGALDWNTWRNSDFADKVANPGKN